MVHFRSFSTDCLIVAILAASIGACSSEKPAPERDTMGEAGSPMSILTPSAGAAAGMGGAAGAIATVESPSAGASGSSGTGGQGGSSAGAGAGGASTGAMAGSGGSAGAMAGSAAAGAAGSEDDPFAGLLDPAPSSCDGLLCFESADCTSLYPDEAAMCHFTSCVDFVCQ